MTTIPTAPLGLLRTKRVRAPNRTTVTMTFEDHATLALRRACALLRPEDGREPSLSLVGRRALTLYLEFLDKLQQAGAVTDEVAAIKKLTAPPSEATKARLRAAMRSA